MEHFAVGTIFEDESVSVPATEIAFEHPVTAADRVAFEILRALEQRRLIPGQRLIETELAIRVGVGRNAVREAIQRLAAKGIVDLSPNRSPAIRKLSLDETLEVLEVAEELFGLLARVAARNFARSFMASAYARCSSN